MHVSNSTPGKQLIVVCSLVRAAHQEGKPSKCRLESTNLPSLFGLLDDCLEPLVRVTAKIIATAKTTETAIKRMPFRLVELTMA